MESQKGGTVEDVCWTRLLRNGLGRKNGAKIEKRCQESVDVSMPQVVEEVVVVVQDSLERIREHTAFEVPQERDPERIAAQSVDVPVPLVMEEFLQERDQECICPSVSGQVGAA